MQSAPTGQEFSPAISALTVPPVCRTAALPAINQTSFSAISVQNVSPSKPQGRCLDHRAPQRSTESTMADAAKA